MRLLFLFCILSMLAGFFLFSETIFVYVEEIDSGATLDFPFREGLFNGLFLRNHIVFDDTQSDYRIEWEKENFKNLVDSAAGGGARFLIAVRVVSRSAPFKETLRSIKSQAWYYCIEVQRELLVEEGELEGDNWGQEAVMDGEALNLLLGEKLAAIVDKICQNPIWRL